MKDVRDQMRSRRFLFAVKNDLNEYCSHFFEKSGKEGFRSQGMK